LLLKESIQFCRDRVTLILILWLYTVEVILCVNAMSFDVKRIPLAIVDLDRSPASRALEQRFLIGDSFIMAGQLSTETEAGAWLQSGRASVALVIPTGFASDLVRDNGPALQILLDGSNSNTAGIARGYALQVIDLFQQSWLRDPRGPHGTVLAVLRAWYNPDQTFVSFMSLSMISLAAFMVGVIHPVASMVREKEVGTIEQLMVTPITTGEMFLAKTLPTVAMGLASVFPSLLILRWFDVPLRGSLLLFLGLTTLFLLSAIGIGILVATVSRTLQQALLLAFFGLFPIMFLSGTVVPIESMPVFLQGVSLFSPLRHYLEVILGIFLKGTGLAELWRQALALLAMGLVLFAAALASFRRSLS
jgi:ABC-2 type transport system permease protein